MLAAARHSAYSENRVGSYYRARYYDVALGRFLTEDPAGFDAGSNFYSYVANNPARYSDPLGECIIELYVVPTGAHNDGFFYHSFLILYDNSGQSPHPPTMLFRGGPGPGGASGGRLEADLGPLNRRSVDQPGDSIYVKVLLNNDCSCGPYLVKLNKLATRIENDHLSYSPIHTSNTVTSTALKELGLAPPNFPFDIWKRLWGWGFSLP